MSNSILADRFRKLDKRNHRLFYYKPTLKTRAISNLLRKWQVEFHQHGVNADRSPEFRDHNQIHFGLELKVR